MRPPRTRPSHSHWAVFLLAQLRQHWGVAVAAPARARGVPRGTAQSRVPAPDRKDARAREARPVGGGRHPPGPTAEDAWHGASRTAEGLQRKPVRIAVQRIAKVVKPGVVVLRLGVLEQKALACMCDWVWGQSLRAVCLWDQTATRLCSGSRCPASTTCCFRRAA